MVDGANNLLKLITDNIEVSACDTLQPDTWKKKKAKTHKWPIICWSNFKMYYTEAIDQTGFLCICSRHVLKSTLSIYGSGYNCLQFQTACLYLTKGQNTVIVIISLQVYIYWLDSLPRPRSCLIETFLSLPSIKIRKLKCNHLSCILRCKCLKASRI